MRNYGDCINLVSICSRALGDSNSFGHSGRMSTMEKLYQACVTMRQIVGCHQRPDRSFFIYGKQFPVCARCTGVFIGEVVAIFSFRVFSLPTVILFSFCALMLFDWLIQYLKIRESTNVRRFITGTLCGFGYLTLILRGVRFLLHILRNT